MVKKYAGRFSKYLRPISVIFDLFVIVLFLYLFLDPSLIKTLPLLMFSISWLISSYVTKFYEVYRFTKLINIISYVFYQLFLYTIIVYAFFGVVETPNPSPLKILNFIIYTFILISAFKFTLFYGLQTFRLGFGGNFRKTIIIGNNDSVNELKKFFIAQKELGYENRKTFNFKSPEELDLDECFNFIKSRNIDEVYCLSLIHI